jgi:hypothetical protein
LVYDNEHHTTAYIIEKRDTFLPRKTTFWIKITNAPLLLRIFQLSRILFLGMKTKLLWV